MEREGGIARKAPEYLRAGVDYASGLERRLGPGGRLRIALTRVETRLSECVVVEQSLEI